MAIGKMSYIAVYPWGVCMLYLLYNELSNKCVALKV